MNNFRAKNVGGSTFPSHDNQHPNHGADRPPQLASVQDYNVTKEQDHSENKVSRTINCLRLQWQSSFGELRVSQSGKIFYLIPVNRENRFIRIL